MERQTRRRKYAGRTHVPLDVGSAPRLQRRALEAAVQLRLQLLEFFSRRRTCAPAPFGFELAQTNVDRKLMTRRRRRPCCAGRRNRWCSRAYHSVTVRSGMILGLVPPLRMMPCTRQVCFICWRIAAIALKAWITASRALIPSSGLPAAWALTPWNLTTTSWIARTDGSAGGDSR